MACAFVRARQKISLTIFSSPFDETAVDLLETLGAPAYKIVSLEAVDLPLIRYAAKTGKLLIISTGMADENEIGEAIEAAACLAAGDTITADAVRSVRPGYGVAPKYLDVVVGRKVVCAVKANTPVKFDLLEPKIK